jgi:hypothetical protein
MPFFTNAFHLAPAKAHTMHADRGDGHISRLDTPLPNVLTSTWLRPKLAPIYRLSVIRTTVRIVSRTRAWGVDCK